MTPDQECIQLGSITAILTAYRRPNLLCRQVEAVRNQSIPPSAVWLWANEPDQTMEVEIAAASFDRVVVCRDNAYVHARFALALVASTPYVAFFDDDALPGRHWFSNCMNVMQQSPGILGSAGVRIHGNSYRQRTMHGWHTPSSDVVEVDLVGHAWFLRTEWVHHMFAVPAVVGTNGEDIELAARCLRLGGIRCYCPPHPADDRSQWGSQRGVELGSDAAAMSRRPSHLEERDRVVEAEMAAGWKPYFLRTRSHARLDFAVESHMPELVMLGNAIPSAQKTLHLHCGTADLWRSVKANRDIGWVQGIESDCRAAGIARGTMDKVTEGNPEVLFSEIEESAFDCIVCQRPETFSRPEEFLRQVPMKLRRGGTLVVLLLNVRHHRHVTALLDGTWARKPLGVLERDQVRFFTRRDVEQLLSQAGFTVEALLSVPGQGHQEWTTQGKIGQISAEGLQVSGLSPEEAEEFYTSHYVVRARLPV